MIVLCHQTKTPIDFCCRLNLILKSLIWRQKFLLVELIKTDNPESLIVQNTKTCLDPQIKIYS